MTITIEETIAPAGTTMPAPTGPLTEVRQVCYTQATLDLLARVVEKHGPVLFHQSGGCCDGSAPMCFPRDEFLIGDHDKCLGDIAGHPFYISRSQFEYWKHTQLTIDVVVGRGGMFSLEGSLGLRFLVRSRLFTEEEWAWLVAHGKV
jgi:uncharacterized protein (DUF779 family)